MIAVRTVYCTQVLPLIIPVDMAATMERLDEYKKYNAQFCKRVLDYLSIMFTAQVRSLHVGWTITNVPVT